MLKEFLSSQVFSVIVGSLLTLVASAIMSKKNVRNSLEEEVAKERIKTYKKIYTVVCQLNHNLSFATEIHIPKDCFLGYIKAGEKEYHKGYCFPTVFYSWNEFNNYKSSFSILLNDNRIFLDQSITNKLSFLDSYLGEIWHLAHEKGDSYLHIIGFALSNEIGDLIQEIENDIVNFINSDNKKKIKNNFSDTYHYEYAKKDNTELNNLFLENTIEQYGDFPLCQHCKYCDNCPLNRIREQETGALDCSKNNRE